MQQHPDHRRTAIQAILFVLLAACAGCWEKIEYTGSEPTSVAPPAVPPVAVEQPSNDTQVNVATPSNDSTSAPSASPPVTTEQTSNNTQASVVAPNIDSTSVPQPPVVATTAEPPKPKVDRYANPPSADVAAETPKPADPTPPVGPVEPPPPANHTDTTTVRRTDAAPVSATVNVGPPGEAPNIRRQAWILGSRLSLAALANDRGMAANNVPGWFDEARSAAKVLGTSVVDLPESTVAADIGPASRQVIDYLIIQGQRIGQDLSKQHSPEAAALFEVALKSNILLLLYSPGSSTTSSIASSISRAATQGRLPAELWKPLVDLLGKQSPLNDVRAAVRQMHNDVDKYLANAAEPSRQ